MHLDIVAYAYRYSCSLFCVNVFHAYGHIVVTRNLKGRLMLAFKFSGHSIYFRNMISAHSIYFRNMKKLVRCIFLAVFKHILCIMVG